ncbi:MAG: extracellular solute-binding protein [Lachnospiraceae bacterium]|nr:extracellular solute-binding protein [Lachnospiraceae bacterium]
MRKKKVLAAILAMAMTLSMAGCGSDAQTGLSSETKSVTSETTESNTEKVKLSVFIPQGSDVVDINENQVFLDLKQATGYDIDLILVPSDDATEKLNLLLASGEYPDVIMGSYFSNQDLEKYGVEEKIFIPLNDLIKENCPNICERFKEHPNWEENMKRSDGNIYGIPSVDSSGVGHVNCSYKMWINEDWLNKLGLKMPATTEEFKQVLKAFKTQDPNGNGIADEIPLSGAINSWNSDPYLFLLNAFGYFTTDYYYLKNDKICSILDQDYIKEGLRYMNDLYSEGLIDIAAFTQNFDQLNAIGNNADIDILGAAGAGHVGMIVDTSNSERYRKYAMMLPLKGPDGYQALPYTTSVSVSGAQFVITDKCKYPDAAIKIADMFSSYEWTLKGQIGIKGVEWDDADPGTFGMDGVTPAKFKYLEYETPAQVKDAWWWTYRGMEPDWKLLIQTEGDIMDVANYESRLYVETMKLRPFAADVDMMPPLTYEGEDSVTFTQISTAVNDYAKIALVEFITGKRNVDSDWNSYLADLDNLGYGKMIDLIQKTYNNQ